MQSKYILFVFITFLAFGKTKTLSKHVHGEVSLDLAVDGKELLILLKSPAESFLGFEYKAKTKAEKEKVSQLKKDWKENLSKILGLEAIKGCKTTSSKWEQKFESKSHSSIVAESYFKCKENLEGKNLKISFKDKYKNIKKIHIQLIRENGSVLSKEFKDKIIKINL